jgi:hypothetical protein
MASELNQWNLEKHFIKPEQLSIADNRIFINIENSSIPLGAVFYDPLEGFVYCANILQKEAPKTCPNGHRAVNWWGGCADITCRYYAYD